MNRGLQYLNLLGVLALAALCVFQWRTDRRLNHEINQLEKTQIDNSQKIAEQAEGLKGANNDLTLFKEQFTKAQTDLNDTKQKLRETERENLQLAAERTQLRETITNWANAVAERDTVIKDANGRINELADRLNASVLKYNELASNYNAVVKDLNATRAGSTKSKSDK